jgi:glycine cleavage system H protein
MTGLPEEETMPEFLETVVGKFTFRVATDRFYGRDGLWVLRVQPESGGRVRVGMTDYLQQESGDAAFVTVRPPGTKLQAGDDLADLETIKVVTTLASPVGGTIAAVNDALQLHPELINQSPYENGWLAEIDATNWEAGRAALLDAGAYFAVMKSQAEEETRKP